MVSKRLLGVWAFFDFALLAFGGLSVAMSIILQGSDDVLVNLTFTPSQLTSALILGILLLITFLISIGAIIQRSHITQPLMVLNWALVVDGIAIIIVGSFFWFVTLAERDNFLQRLTAATPEVRIAVQDKLNCCGYYNTTDFIEFGGQVCTNAAAAVTVNSSCVLPLTNFTDLSLNTAFTFIYGFMTAVVPLLLATLCVIKKREEDERFKKIDAKRGGRGFV